MESSPYLQGSLSRPSSPVYLSPLRRASDVDLSFPPRYSTLIGALPPPTFSNSIASDDDEPISLSPISLISYEPPSPQLPAYCSSAQQRSLSLGDTSLSESAVSYSYRNGQTQFPASTHSDSRNGIQQHEYHIMNRGRAPWATLKLHSRTSLSSDRRVPHFTEDDVIRGDLELNLDPPQNINSISLSLRGRITTNFYVNGSYTFLEQPITSWDRNDGDPRSMYFTPETTIKKFEGKLSGQYTWPFTLTFPKEVTIRGQHQYLSKAYPTPRSFLERGTNGSVQYDLVLRVTHGLLRADSKLNVEIVYVPDITPEPFSLLREAAYRENTRLQGPDDDPEGWFTLPHANIHGKLFSSDQHAHLRCTVSLAKPHCYPRGSVIPCHISIHSTNTEALDILANHRSVRVCLVRRIHFHEVPKQAHSRKQHFPTANGNQVPPGVIEQVETIERAVWWPTNSDEPDTRCLEGELHLNQELQPSSQFLLFKVSYTVELYPFESSVFKYTNSGLANTDNNMRKPKALISHPVIIATQHRQDQVPVTVTKLKPYPLKRIEFPPPDFSFCAL
ncbi:hypothetical protein BYT27DRAFT_7339440 [Phlegmacium glaucopus]|nr:hypothetical protein BYT27DRAFT_7339440 [Phlegmacium glaucopus]